MRNILIIMLVSTSSFIHAQTEECIINMENATLYFEQKEFDKSIIEYTKVISRSGWFQANYARGICNYMLKNNEEALLDFEHPKVKEYFQLDTNYLWYVGQTLHRLELRVNAYENYKLAETYGMSIEGQLGLSLGTICYFLGKLEEAEFYLKNYSHKKNGPSGLHTNLGWIHIENKNYQEAVVEFGKALNYAKKNEASSFKGNELNNLGFGYGLNGDIKKGVKLVKKSIKMNNQNSFAFRNLAYLYMLDGNKKKSCKKLDESLKLGIIEEWGQNYVLELLEYCEMNLFNNK